jgi:hypothetical protein
MNSFSDISLQISFYCQLLSFSKLKVVLRIRDILVRIQILGSVLLTNGSSSGSGSCSSLSTFTTPTKNNFFSLHFYAYSLLKVHLNHSSKIQSHKEVTKRVEIKVFLNFLLVYKDADLDPYK